MIHDTKVLKSLILGAVLIFPILIFLFLKKFGENKFEVPVYYEEGVVYEEGDCQPVTGKYVVPEILPGHSWEGVLTLICFREEEWDRGGEEYKQLTRICDQISDRAVHFFRVAGKAHSPMQCIRDIRADKTDIENWKKCGLVLKEDSQVVLVDEKGRVRGYYDLGDREEADRLLVEVEIIGKNLTTHGE